jgi:signal transduction histidine kinase
MSLRRRFVLALAAFSLLLAVAGGWFSWSATSRALERELDEKLMWVAGAAAEVGLQGNFALQLRPGNEEGSIYTALRSQLLGLLQYVDEAHIFRRPNTLLVTTYAPEEYPIGTELRFLDGFAAELEESWETGEAVTPVFEGEDGRFYKYGFKQLGETDAMLAVLMRADFLAPLVQFRNTLIAGSVGAVLLSVLLAAVLAGNIVRPLERLSRAALRIQRGRWDQAVADEGGDELGRLARAMERMRMGIVQRDEQLRLMLAQVAHEIRNPLGGLELFASAALETEDREERLRLLGRVRKEVEALNEIINSFLAFARPLHPQVELHDLRKPLQEAADLIEMQLAWDGGTLATELPEEPLMARADPDHVKRAVLNLLQNAAQAGKHVRLDAWWQNGEAVVAVSDDGPGVKKDLRERIFEPFVTDREKGAGLGLAIVKRVLESNGARVVLVDPDAEDGTRDPARAVGGGAEFRVYFQGSEDLPAASPSS